MDTNIEHPAHYTRGRYECIDIIENLGLDFHLANVLKYIWRAGHKDADMLTDLKKARWYLDRKIRWLEGSSDDSMKGTGDGKL